MLRTLKSLLKAKEGNVAMMVAVSAFTLTIAAGAAVDMARAQILQSKIQSALDASGLAAGATLPSKPATKTAAEWVQEQAQRYFNANFMSGYLGAGTVTVTATPSSDEVIINLSASTTQPTYFMRMVGINTVNIGAASQIARDNVGYGMEIVLSLDTTSSMSCSLSNSAAPCNSGAGTKIYALKNAVAILMDILYGTGNDTYPNVYVGVVPFSQTVNIGTSHSSWMDSSSATGSARVGALDWGPSNSWYGCITERSGGQDITAAAPTTSYPFGPYYFPTQEANNATEGTALKTFYGYYYNWNPEPAAVLDTYPIEGWKKAGPTYLSPLNTTVQGPNLSCPEAMLPMEESKTVILNKVNSMIAAGDTMINLGAVWGWRMLDPNWRGLWGGDMNTHSLPKDYAAANNTKALIIISDGWNNIYPYNFTAFGWLYDNVLGSRTTAGANTILNTKTATICTNIKAAGIKIYAIAYGVNDGNPANPASANFALLNSCATPGYFFEAPDDARLQDAFRTIGNSLINLRVAK